MSARAGFRNDLRGDRGDSRIEQLRVPPMHIEAEQAVLGAIMLVGSYPNPAWEDVSDLLTKESFYRRDHQLIWRAIEHRISKSLPTDAVTLGSWFESQGLAEQVAGGAYLVELASTTPSAANVRAYAQIVAEMALLRQLIEVGTDMVNWGFDPEGREPIELIGLAQTRTGALLDTQPCDLEDVAPVMDRVFDRLNERYQTGGGQIPGSATGFVELDELLGGLAGGDLIVLAARPSMGKTTLAQNIAEFFAIKSEKAVAFFSFEMKPEQLGDRLLASVGDVNGDAIRRGQLEDEEWTRVNAAMRRIRAAKLSISKPKTARVEHVCAQIRRRHRRQPLSLIVIDYLQLLHVSGDNRAQGLGDISRALKLLACEIDVPIILLSQLNREADKRKGEERRPVMADLRDSGAIEQDADIILFLYRDDYYNPKTSRYKGTAEIICAKQRQGRLDTVRLKYRGDRYRFENLPFDWEPDPEPAPKESKRGGGMAKAAKHGRDAAAGEV